MNDDRISAWVLGVGICLFAWMIGYAVYVTADQTGWWAIAVFVGIILIPYAVGRIANRYWEGRTNRD